MGTHVKNAGPQRHNGIINNYILKFQKSLILHLHHLSQVHARCLFGAHAMPIWCARDAHLVRMRCMFGWPVVRACGARLAPLQCASGLLAVHVWLAHGVRAVCVWFARDLLT